MWQLWLKFLILIYLFLHVVLFLRKRTAESNLKSLLPHFLLLYFPALSLFSYSFPNLYSEWAWKLALPSTYYLQHCTMFLKIPPANLESKTCHLIFILLFMLWPCVCVCVSACLFGCACVCMDHLRKLILFFHLVDPGIDLRSLGPLPAIIQEAYGIRMNRKLK